MQAFIEVVAYRPRILYSNDLKDSCESQVAMPRNLAPQVDIAVASSYCSHLEGLNESSRKNILGGRKTGVNESADGVVLI